MKFKVGDKVTCIDNKGREDDLELNKIYIVKQYHNLFDNEFFVNDDSIYSSCMERRFELAYIKEFKNKLDKILEE